MKTNPLRPSDTSPKSDSIQKLVTQSFHVGFGGGRRGSGVVARCSGPTKLDSPERVIEDKECSKCRSENTTQQSSRPVWF
jgi:hypothetical protein